jgi:hypothetical protein
MKLPWQFAGLKTTSGNVLKDYLCKDKTVQNRVDAFLRRLRVKDRWKLPDYRALGAGWGEVRFEYQNVEYRFYGYFGPQAMQFTVFHIGDERSSNSATFAPEPKSKNKLTR